ncbi:MAG: BamA/TamA family outer membrane protein [Bacteroidota bacterium]|nr:BamA/TamA family outer membrane protein [Bacteroidota bacterium]
MKKHSLVISLLIISALSFSSAAFSQDNAGKRWKMGGVPAIAYDSDMGFRYGALANFYDHGPDMELYPAYRHSLYVEWSHTTKGNDIKQMKYDSKYLIPKVRVTASARLETEQAMDFYGFNGYESLYNPAFTDAGSDEYLTRMYYRMNFRSLRLKADFQGELGLKKLKWYAGVAHYNLQIGSVDIEGINEKKDDEGDLLPDIPGLYDEYVNKGYIPADQAEGGYTSTLKFGLVADTRDKEANPNRGIWAETFIVTAPGFIGNKSAYTGVIATFRHYLPIIHNKLTFAYRINYQSTLSGSIPWFMMVYKPDTYVSWNGLGGSKTLRGIMRNRVVGEGAVLGNFELRWKFVNFNLGGQKIYLALSPFVDAAKITKKYALQPDVTGDTDGVHLSYGAGLHIALNENFIIAVDYGMAADKRDGTSGLYIGLDFLF